MSEIDRITSELRNEADIDFFDISLIAGTVQEDLGLRSEREIRRCTLEVIRGLMARGVYPGDYTMEGLQRGEGFQFWSGEPDELLKRIEAEWIALGKTPNLAEPICWFALRPQAE